MLFILPSISPSVSPFVSNSTSSPVPLLMHSALSCISSAQPLNIPHMFLRTVLVPSPLLAHTCPTFVCRPPRSVFATQFKLFKASHVVTPKLYCTGLAKGEMTEEGSSKACGIEVRAGRPDFTDLLVQSKTESDRPTVKALDGGFQVIGVYACGPKPMMKSVREAVQRASGSGVKFYLHEETYEL